MIRVQNNRQSDFINDCTKCLTECFIGLKILLNKCFEECNDDDYKKYYPIYDSTEDNDSDQNINYNEKNKITILISPKRNISPKNRYTYFKEEEKEIYNLTKPVAIKEHISNTIELTVPNTTNKLIIEQDNTVNNNIDNNINDIKLALKDNNSITDKKTDEIIENNDYLDDFELL